MSNTVKATLKNKKSQRGFARWKNIPKAERSKEMSKVAKGLWKKIRAGDLTTGYKKGTDKQSTS